MGRDIRAVLFDLDGTLLDTLSDIASAMNAALAAHGLPTHPVDAYRLMVGSGADVLVRRALASGGEDARPHPADDLVGSLLDRMKQEYAANTVSRTRPYPGIPKLMGELAELGLPLAVLSNKPDELVKPIVAAFFADDTFSVIRGLRDGFPRKPDPAGACAIASELGVKPRECVYLGDSDVDMQTARNAGMIAIGAGWGFRGRAELLRAGAARVIDDPGELTPLIRGGFHAEGADSGRTD